MDVAYLCGAPLNNVLYELESQLGGFNGEFELPARDGYSRLYDRGEVRHVGGQIYMIRYELEKPLRRSEALQSSDFPEYVEDYISTPRIHFKQPMGVQTVPDDERQNKSRVCNLF